MPVTFCTLASGSGGNSALLRADGLGLLIDVGLDERLIGARLAAIGAGWKDVTAVLLTHAHSDHWNDFALAQIRRLNVPLYCHPNHEATVNRYGGEYAALRKSGLVRFYDHLQPFPLTPTVAALPVQVPHDSDPTFGFRIAGTTAAGNPWAVGYASDLGAVPEEVFAAFHDVSLLALEFNHDEAMQRKSGRPQFLIRRVMGSRGHLSNTQATEAVRKLAGLSPTPALRHLVQLHLSQDCNTPALALGAVRKMLDELKLSVQVTTARQHTPSPILMVAE
jgi:phosphoribosyl 1,2-cyclic phosphodiesterase